MKTISTYGKINFQEIMELDFINNGPKKYDCYEDIFCSLAHKVFDYLKIDTDYLIDVSIVDNQQVLEQRIVYRRFWAIQCYSAEYNCFVFYAFGRIRHCYATVFAGLCK